MNKLNCELLQLKKKKLQIFKEKDIGWVSVSGDTQGFSIGNENFGIVPTYVNNAVVTMQVCYEAHNHNLI